MKGVRSQGGLSEIMIIFHGISQQDWTARARIPIVGRFEDGNRFKRRTMESRRAQFKIGQVVKHRLFPFRGVIFDVDPQFSNTEEWWLSIPEDVRPHKDQPFYHLLAENAQTHYVAYVSQQNLLADESGEPVAHPEVGSYFGEFRGGHYVMRPSYAN
jgi:heat shock protein HspQ